jgi:hypothetical protein
MLMLPIALTLAFEPAGLKDITGRILGRKKTGKKKWTS